MASENLGRQLAFERLLFEISTKFVNLPPTEVDREINDALKKIVEFLDFDQSVFGEFKGDDGTLKVIHGYTSMEWQETKGLVLSAVTPNAARLLRQGNEMNFPNLPRGLPKDWHQERAYVERVGMKSCAGVSLKVGGTVLGVLILESYRGYRQWTDRFFQQLKLLAQIFANAMARKQTDIKLKKAFSRIQDLSERLKAENRYLRESISSQGQLEEVIGTSRSIRYVLEKIEQVARTSSTVLFLGETGTGKTLLARRLHQMSPRNDQTMLKINCATLPANLLESELFGHEKGAFTGALSKKIGRFEIASGSTLFLDEIGELPLDLQAKLLRVLDEGEFERLGGTASIKVDVRIVAATNRDLPRMVREHKFRSDLYYRLNVYPIEVPPLRARTKDIPDMVRAFVKEFSKTMGKDIRQIPEKDLAAAACYSWPGNIRELKNQVENAMISSPGNTLRLTAPETGALEMSEDLRFSKIQRRHILKVLAKTGWQIKGEGGAAQLLDLKPSTLYSKMKKLGIQPKKNRSRSGDT